jgi:ATP-dependent exoDNAse (exonuclease V) beta subunit
LKQGKARAAYRSVVVDEAQDMSTNAFALLRQVVPEQPNDLFLVGDGHQRIYRKRVVLGHAGVNIQGRGRRLRINYRTTDEIRRFAVALLEGVSVDDLDASAPPGPRGRPRYRGRAAALRRS